MDAETTTELITNQTLDFAYVMSLFDNVGHQSIELKKSKSIVLMSFINLNQTTWVCIKIITMESIGSEMTKCFPDVRALLGVVNESSSSL